MIKEYKISFCTVCMNRLHHLQQTLPQNISSNKSYKNVEFVVLDYNSSDGTEEWIKRNMKSHIDSGKLIYYKTEEPEFFNRSHSRNMAFKLASGDIISNIDADNFTGNNFASYINHIFNKNKNIFLVADTQKRYYFLRNAFGRFCVWKNDLMKLGGLDEQMISYGSETLDFYERLQMLGKKEVVIDNLNFLNAISHGDEERINNEFFMKNLKMFLISYISHKESEVIFLFRDNKYEKATIKPEKIQTHLPASIDNKTIVKGIFKLKGKDIHLTNEVLLKSKERRNLFVSIKTDRKYYQINNIPFLIEVGKNYSFIMNNILTSSNKKSKNSTVNNMDFGRGCVIKNFQKKSPLLID